MVSVLLAAFQLLAPHLCGGCLGESRAVENPNGFHSGTAYGKAKQTVKMPGASLVCDSVASRWGAAIRWGLC
jgi:hypothetical protein